jgi:hypothetical protein
MKKPPKLTNREAELVPFLVQGRTRRDIALELGVSEDTVKVHTRNLLKKFDAIDVIDAFNDLLDYQTIFSPDGFHFPVFFNLAKWRLTVYDEARGVKVERKIDFEVLRGPLERIDTLVRLDNSVVHEIKRDGRPGAIRMVRGEHFIDGAFEKPLQTGDVGSFEESYVVLGTESYSAKFPYWSINTFYPTERVEVEIRSENKFKDRKFWHETHQVSVNELDDRIALIKAQPLEAGYQMIVNNPIVGCVHTIYWTK